MLNCCKRITILILMAFMVASLAGCEIKPAVWNGENQFKNIVSYQNEHFSIPFAVGQTRLSDIQKKQIKEKLSPAYNVETVFLSACYPGTPENQSRLTSVIRVVKKLGYQPKIVMANKTQGGAHDCVNISLIRLVVIPPHCPNLVSPGSNYYKIGSNFGCTTARDFGLSVAYPQELIHPGRGTGPVPSERQIIGIENYNKGETQSLYDSEDSTGTQTTTGETTTKGGADAFFAIAK